MLTHRVADVRRLHGVVVIDDGGASNLAYHKPLEPRRLGQALALRDGSGSSLDLGRHPRLQNILATHECTNVAPTVSPRLSCMEREMLLTTAVTLTSSSCRAP